jgi:hypothetical protein
MALIKTFKIASNAPLCIKTLVVVGNNLTWHLLYHNYVLIALVHIKIIKFACVLSLGGCKNG